MKKSIYAMMAAVLALAGGMSVQAENMATPLQIVCVTADGNNLQQDEYADSLMVCGANTGLIGREDYMATPLQITPDRRSLQQDEYADSLMVCSANTGLMGREDYMASLLQIKPDRRGPWGLRPLLEILV